MPPPARSVSLSTGARYRARTSRCSPCPRVTWDWAWAYTVSPVSPRRRCQTAADLARTLVDGVLADRQDASSRRIAVILNGLGRTKYEELFVVWGEVARLLRERGYTIVEPEVGELVTSLDMAGCSLTLMWLDGELERYWTAPADTPAYKKGAAAAASQPGDRRTDADIETATATPQFAELSDDAGRNGGRLIARAFDAMAEML